MLTNKIYYSKLKQQGGEKLKNKLKSARENANLTQKELSENSGVSRVVINQIENGKRTIVTSETLVKLAGALNCDVADIFF